MEVPIPCAFGEDADCEGRTLPFTGVSWFKWSSGMDYTYYFLTNNKWREYAMFSNKGTEYTKKLTIPDALLACGPMKDKGIPLKGRGRAWGVALKKERRYIDFIFPDDLYAHILVECNDRCEPIPGGDMIFPITWEEDRINRVLLKSMLKSIQKTVQKPTPGQTPIKEVSMLREPRQLSFADYISEAEMRRR